MYLSYINSEYYLYYLFHICIQTHQQSNLKNILLRVINALEINFTSFDLGFSSKYEFWIGFLKMEMVDLEHLYTGNISL